MRQAHSRTALLLIPILYSCYSCGPEVDDDVVAQVDDVEITVEDLLRFKGDMPDLLLSEEEGIDELREYLQSVIDLELLLLEARVQGLDRQEDFVQRLEEEWENKLLATYEQREIQEKVKIDLPREELRQRWKKHRWSRMLKLARIRLESRADAAETARQLELGASFEQLARERSIDAETAGRGGLLEPFFGRGNFEELGLPLEVADAVFELEVGQTSRPLETAKGFELFKVVEEKPAPASYFLVFTQGAHREAYKARRKSLLVELAEQFNVQLDPDGLAALMGHGVSAGDSLRLPPEEKARLLCTFDGGRLTLTDFAEHYNDYNPRDLARADSAGIAGYIYHLLLPEYLPKLAIRRGELADEEELVRWKEAKRRTMLVDLVREREVLRHVDLSDTALRQYYAEHPDSFVREAQYQVVEILAATRQEADELLGQIRGGGDMEELAARHSLRHGADKSRGHLHMHSTDRRLYGEVLDAVAEAEPGAVTGPVEIGAAEGRQTGFSVFKVEEQIEAGLKPFELVKEQVRYWSQTQQEARLYSEFIARLRQKHAGRIVILEDHLAAHAKAGS